MRKLLAAVLVIVAAGCNREQASVGPSGAGATVSGRVLDFATSAGVSGATVVFGGATAVTEADGSYVVDVPAIKFYQPLVDGVSVGSSRVTSSTYRGDFLVHPGNCISRYGTLADSRTLRPVAGATLSLQGRTTTSGTDGWYRIDLGCPMNQTPGGTTFMYVSHPNYADRSATVGRGVVGVSRLDIDLERR